MKRQLGFILVIILLAIAAYFLLVPRPVANSTPEPDVSEEISDSSAMRAEENMLVVSEQRPGNTVIGSIIYLASPGYLVIHEDNDGAPGVILGASAIVPAGESTNVKVTLSRASKDGETLHAMLHSENGGNTTFAAAEDMPVQSSLGGSLSGWFEVSSDAPVDVPVSI